MNVRKIITVLVHAFVGWALCAATMGIAMSITTLEDALFLHAIAALPIYIIVSVVYFDTYNFTTPLQTAIIFVAFVMLMDFFVVALLINRSLDMFASLLGTWIPFALIFVSTLWVGEFILDSNK